MSWNLVRYVLATVLALWSLGHLRMVFVYLGIVRSPLDLGGNLPFATRSLTASVGSGVYSAILFCSNRPMALLSAIGAFWIARWLLRKSLRRLWFHYLAHVVLEIQRRSESSTEETSGPKFREAIAAAYDAIESEHVPAWKRHKAQS